MRFVLLAIMLPLILAGNTVPLEPAGSYMVVPRVFVNGQGPFRFLLDTGAESCAITERVAARAGVRPKWRVEQVTATGSRLLPAGPADLEAGGVALAGVEVLIGGLELLRQVDEGIDGVLGQGFLANRNYLLDLKTQTLTFNAAPIPGERLPFERHHGRILVAADVEGKRRHLVLDSGTPALVLFGGQMQTRGGLTVVSTGAGQTYVGSVHRKLTLGRMVFGRVNSVEIPHPGGTPGGLLPASLFERMYVDNRQGFISVEAAPSR